jgi:DNA-binding MarR family transcriptional regulator
MSEPRWLTDQQQQAWRKFIAVVQLLPGALEAPLQRGGDLNYFEYVVLAMLSEAPRRARRMSQLAALTNASLSRLSHVVARLERRGWLQRRPSPEDGRANIAVLTDAGYAKVVDTAPTHVESVRQLVFDALTPLQVEQLDEICGALLDRLDPRGRLAATLL